MRRSTYILAMGIALLVGCSKDDPPPSTPGAVNLVFPENNSLCITGISQGPATSQVTFRWNAASNADSYEVLVSPLDALGVERKTTTGLSIDFVIDKGTPYSWQVRAINEDSGAATPSEIWQFFNAGSTLTYPPFPARLLEPASGAPVFPDQDGEALLVWEVADPDNDLDEIEVYYGTDPEALPLLAALCCQADRIRVSIRSGEVYYWQVLCRDKEGNTSRSGISSFRAL